MKLLLIAYHFPPDGEIGSVRPYELARRLPALGIDCTVLTVDPAHAESFDPRYVPEEPRGLTIVRTGVERTPRDLVLDAWRSTRRAEPRPTEAAGAAARDAGQDAGQDGPRSGVGGLRQWVLKWLAFPDLRYGWRGPALAAAERLLATQRFDAVLSTSPPRVCHMVAASLRRRHGITWIMDMRDPWYSVWTPGRPSLQERLHHRMFDRHAAQASVVVANTRRLQDVVEGVVRGVPVLCIPNGFDPVSGEIASEPLDRAEFRIAHFGQVMGRRSERPFLEGLKRWLDRSPAAAGTVAVSFIGGASREGVLLRDELGLAERVRFEARVPRESVPDLMAQQYVLLLLANDQVLQVPGKAYEYLAAGRRVLAIAEGESATGDLLRGVPGSAVCGSTDGVADSLQLYWTQWRAGEPARVPREEILDRMTYAARAAEYSSAILEAVRSRRPA